MRKEKKHYIAPRLVIHGNVEKITLHALARTNDSPGGGSNKTIFPSVT